jgi:uncharacterized membrane protein
MRHCQAYIVTALENVAKVKVCIEKYQSFHALAVDFNMSDGTVHKIMQHLRYRKVCAKWVPQMFTRHKQQHTALALEHLQHCQAKGNVFL